MVGTTTRGIQKLLDLMGPKLGLCRHHAPGQPPILPRRKDEGRLA